MATGGSPVPVLRLCRVAGCSVRFWPGKHQSCCSLCAETSGAAHSGRCRRAQRHLVRDRPETRQATVPCSTRTCGRLTGNGYRSCCSVCHATGGEHHSRRCDQSQPGPVDVGNADQRFQDGGFGGAAAPDMHSAPLALLPCSTSVEANTAADGYVDGALTAWRPFMNDQDQMQVSDPSSGSGQTEVDSASMTASKAAGPDFDLQEMD